MLSREGTMLDEGRLKRKERAWTRLPSQFKPWLSEPSGQQVSDDNVEAS
jgi:hypothetical protein